MAERPAEPAAPAPAPAALRAAFGDAVRPDPGGPLLVPGPVDVELADGTRVRSARPVVAICACRRSKRYPFCDTSHRERARPGDGGDAAAGSGPRSDD